MSRAILWDMDGTLIDSEPAHEAAFHDAVMQIGLRVPTNLHEGLLGASGDEVFARLRSIKGFDLTFDQWTETKLYYFERYANAIERLEPKASNAKKLAGQGVPMGMVTNSTPQEVALCMKATELDRFLDVIVSRADVKDGKPAPEGYLLAARLLEVEPSRCLVVEDSEKGTQAGLAAGMSVLYQPQTSTRHIPAGAHYFPPDTDCAGAIETFLKTGLVQ